MKRYINHDERLGDTDYEFIMPDMIACYRVNHWDEIRDENGDRERLMTDDEIIEDVLGHDVTEVE